ncbi:DUF805 domain-containing protein [Propionimicrobium sp. PCR01-08-3]|uniref:DUF805 domain-containing protein n=1 Tax=Propionimicrobium sp. PCR01-08-3 TaxID=3052086 RepID=UPI00255C83C0|nr:DUF805 domain-containing protein [Propionimicrobium sp. PCR01-08-3]WIY83392.1 DUF805 domain-containing protein [Propionimicrobium sp. PCR01-08-3]
MSDQSPSSSDPESRGNGQQWGQWPTGESYPGPRGFEPYSQQPSYPQQSSWQSQQTPWDAQQPRYDQPPAAPVPYGQQPHPYQQPDPYQQQTPYLPQVPYAQPGPYQDSFSENPYGPNPYGSFASPGAGRPRPSVGPVEAVKLFFKNYAVFSGRASRSEYWWVQLFFALVYLLWVFLFVVFGGFASLVTGYDPYGYGSTSAGLGAGFVLLFILGCVMGVAVIVPSFALTWRRFHDTDKSGAMYFISFIPYVGILVVLILLAMPSVPTAWQRWDHGQLPVEN